MKKILFKKLLFDCLKFFLLCLIGISAIVWVFQAVNYLDIMVEDGRNYSVYFKYTFLNFPKIISKLFPFALFLAFFYVISKYENSNELIIFWTHGISKQQVVKFFLKSSILIMLVQMLLLIFLVPWKMKIKLKFRWTNGQEMRAAAEDLTSLKMVFFLIIVLLIFLLFRANNFRKLL